MPTHPIRYAYTHYGTLLVLLAGSIAGAQDDPATPPASTTPSAPKHQQVQILDPANDALPRMGTNQTPIRPTEPLVSTPHQTGLTAGQDWLKVVNNTVASVAKPSALAEGSFVLSRYGRLVPAPNDRLIFVPAPDQRLPGEGPVLLLPCAALERLESVWANQPITLSGEILTYHGRNHLLISDFELGVEMMPVPSPDQMPDHTPEASPTPAASDKLTDDATDAEHHGLDDDPDVMELLRELDAENLNASGSLEDPRYNASPGDNQTNQIGDRGQSGLSNQLQTTPPELAPGVREGALMMRRPARLDRAPDGSWIVVFDNDEQYGIGGIELTVLPCALLMSMENQAIAFGDTARFIVSGRLYIHNNRGYILPTFYQRLRTSDIKPWQ